ncbi:hypothetical protein OAM67_01895 [bacterium]|nr:hypothetical protein [bacterium]
MSHYATIFPSDVPFDYNWNDNTTIGDLRQHIVSRVRIFGPRGNVINNDTLMKDIHDGQGPNGTFKGLFISVATPEEVRQTLEERKKYNDAQRPPNDATQGCQLQ